MSRPRQNEYRRIAHLPLSFSHVPTVSASLILFLTYVCHICHLKPKIVFFLHFRIYPGLVSCKLVFLLMQLQFNMINCHLSLSFVNHCQLIQHHTEHLCSKPFNSKNLFFSHFPASALISVPTRITTCI